MIGASGNFFRGRRAEGTFASWIGPGPSHRRLARSAAGGFDREHRALRVSSRLQDLFDASAALYQQEESTASAEASAPLLDRAVAATGRIHPDRRDPCSNSSFQGFGLDGPCLPGHLLQGTRTETDDLAPPRKSRGAPQGRVLPP